MSPSFLLSLLLVAAASAAAAAADIPLGSTLYASDPNSRWASPNNTFAVNFIAASDQTLAAAITYYNFTIWTAAASVNSSAVLRLLPSGDLQLLPSSTATTPLWSSRTADIGVSAASLEESGNFVLKNC